MRIRCHRVPANSSVSVHYSPTRRRNSQLATLGEPAARHRPGEALPVPGLARPLEAPSQLKRCGADISTPASAPLSMQQLLTFGAGPNSEGGGGELPLVEAVQAQPADLTIVEVGRMGACCGWTAVVAQHAGARRTSVSAFNARHKLCKQQDQPSVSCGLQGKRRKRSAPRCCGPCIHYRTPAATLALLPLGTVGRGRRPEPSQKGP